MKLKIILFVLTLFFIGAKADVALHFQFVFGPNPERARHMKAEKLFVTEIQIDLAKAAMKGDTNKMLRLIASGADVNAQGAKGMRPLFWALINENYRGFKCLLENGADPNALVTVQTPAPESALTLAASLDDPQYLKELLEKGANPNLPVGNPSQETAVFTACFYDLTNNVSILLKHGAKIDWQASDDVTPLHKAIASGKFRTALFLLESGANPLIKDKWNYTPIDTFNKFGKNLSDMASRADKFAYNQLVKKFANNTSDVR